jgi:amino acid transporter
MHTGKTQAQADDAVLGSFGYKEELRRALGPISSFAMAFALVSVTTTIFTLFAVPFQSLGGIGIWVWLPAIAGVYIISLVYGHLVVRMPLTGYAYHWSTKLVNLRYGWFTGYNALLVQWTATGTIAVAFGTAFAPVFWDHPSRIQVIGLSIASIVAVVIINTISIRVTALVNNAASGTELIGTVGLILLLGIGLFYFDDAAGPRILTQIGSSTGQPITVAAFAAALLVPAFTIGGWEGCADLAEETIDPARTAPKSMRRAILISGFAGFISFAVIAMAIPGDVESLVNSTDTNPVVEVFRSHFGTMATDVLLVLVFVSMLSCILGNLTVGVRTGYALSRDNMLPGSTWLRKINPTTQTPIRLCIVIGIVGAAITLLSGGLINVLASMTAAMLYITYGLTLVGALIGASRDRIPDADPTYFSLGRWLKPLTIIGIAWALIVILSQLVPGDDRSVVWFVVVFEAIGLVWYFAVLGSRVAKGVAGPNYLRDQSFQDNN